MRIVDSDVLSRCEPGAAQGVPSPPGILSLSNGQVIATYRTGTAKAGDDEVIRMVGAGDSGRTWSEPRITFELPRLPSSQRVDRNRSSKVF